MDWTRGYSAEFRAVKVDRASWADGERLAGASSFAVNRSTDKLVETGSMNVVADYFQSGYYRLQMVAEQDGEIALENVATLWFDSESETEGSGLVEIAATGRSVLWPASTRSMARGEFAAAGTDGAAKAASLLRECIDAPVEVFGAFTLDRNVVFDFGATYIDGAAELLDGAGWCMRIDGDGTVRIEPKPEKMDELVAGLDFDSVRMVGRTKNAPLSGVANVYRAASGDEEAVAVNDDPLDPYSTANRPITETVDQSPTMVDGESLKAYAERRLRETGLADARYTHTREYLPGVLPFSLVPVGDGSAAVESQALAFGKGVTVQETASRKERPWS